MENQLFRADATIIAGTHLNLRARFIFPRRNLDRICDSFSNSRSAKSRVAWIYMSRDLVALFPRPHRGMSSPPLLSLSSCASYAIVRKRRCRYSVRPMRPAALLGMHRSRHDGEKRRRRRWWRRIELSWFAAGVINVRALEASPDHIAFVINRFGGFPRPPAPFAIMSCTFHYKFPLVSLPLRVYVHASTPARIGRACTERSAVHSLEDRKGSRIRRGEDVFIVGRRRADKAKVNALSPLRVPRDINSCYSYVYRRAISRGSISK